MLRTALIYGVISGAIVIAIITIGLATSGGEGAGATQWFGYLIMLIALSLILVGVKRHRDVELGGVIKFLPAFGVGLAIATVAGIVYVIGWEAYLASTGYTFYEEYSAAYLETRRADGLSGEALQAEIEKLDALNAQYANPLFRLPLTFMEIFPVGVLVALISAALLRNPRFLARTI